MALVFHGISKWDHHTSLVYPAKFASSKEPEYNMSLLQCIMVMLFDKDIDDCFFLNHDTKNSPK
jgi:hypothetical protein